MKKIVFLRDNYPNPRFVKRLLWLVGKYELSIIYWEKRKKSDWKVFELEGVNVFPINIPCNYTNPLKRVPSYYEFCRNVTKQLGNIMPDLIYAESLDALDIAYKYRMKNQLCKVIYEVADLHRFIVDPQKSIHMKFVQFILKNMDRRDCKIVDNLVLTSEQYYQTYFKNIIDEKKVVFIPNIPNLKAFEKYEKKVSEKKFTVGFIGGIRYIEQIRLLIDASQEVGCHVLLAGEEHGDTIKKSVENMPNVTYVGRYDFDLQVAGLYQMCDVIYSVYDADMRNVQVALPNKLYESIYCELPLIVADNTYLAQLVKKWNVGVAVNHKDKLELINELRKLITDKSYYNSFVEGCKKHKNMIDSEQYIEKYHIMINSLLM